MKEKTAPLTISVVKTLRDRLEADALALDRSISWVVNRILREHYERQDSRE